MERIEVGSIEGYPVIYVPERDLVFCKNTVVPVQKIIDILKSPNERHHIESSNLDVTKQQDKISFGCLSTTISNIKTIKKQIWKVKKTSQ